MIHITGNAQQIFDTVVDHLATQKQQAVTKSGYCAYKDNKNLKCAIGCLILDEEYTMDIEENDIQSLYSNSFVDIDIDGVDEPLEFLIRLQQCHDGAETVEELRTMLRYLADDYELNDHKVANITEWSHLV